MRQFDFHEFLGYIAPGMLLLVGLRCIWPEVEETLPISGITFGEFGIGIVLAYVAGQLLQTIGNGIEKAWWRLWGGMPTDWLRTGKRELIAPAQRAHVEAKVGRMLGSDSFKFIGVNGRQWYSITRQAYAAVAGAGRAVRIDVFNGYYGLCRGLVASLLVLFVCILLSDPSTWKVPLAVAALLSLAIYRMHRFALHYSREVFVQFLALPDSDGKGDTQ